MLNFFKWVGIALLVLLVGYVVVVKASEPGHGRGH